MSGVECVVDRQNTLGEGPVWSVDEQKLYWVDIEKSELRCYDPATKGTEVWKTPERVGSFAVREQGGLLVAFESGLIFGIPKAVNLNEFRILSRIWPPPGPMTSAVTGRAASSSAA